MKKQEHTPRQSEDNQDSFLPGLTHGEIMRDKQELQESKFREAVQRVASENPNKES